MSLLVVYVVPEGLLFAADRNLSRAGRTSGETTAKVLDIDGVLVGYVGRAHVVGEAIDAWLRGFFDRHAGSPLRELGPALGEELEAAWSGRPEAERGTIIHLGGFEEGSDGSPLPVVWYVRDFEIQDDGRYAFIGGFEARDELKQEGDPPYFRDATGNEVQTCLRTQADPLPWAGFRQSFDLGVFSTLDGLLWPFLNALVAGLARERTHDPPSTLDEWEPFVKFSVYCYAAYFQAFYPPDQQLVGGGVDLVSLPWPGESRSPNRM